MKLLFTMPIRTVSEANRASHEHWRARQKRAKQQRFLAEALFKQEAMRYSNRLPCTVTLARIAPRPLDSDNHASALKHVRDGIADALGVDDRDERVDWKYGEQIRGRAREYAVKVEVESL